jgi:hypothetical protein
LKYYPVLLEGLSKTMKTLRQRTRLSSRNSNQAPLENKHRALSLYQPPRQIQSLNCSVDIATYWMAGARFMARVNNLSSLHCPDWLWGLPTFLASGYEGFFSLEIKLLGLKLTIHFHLLSRSRMVDLHLHSPYVFVECCLIN